MTVPKPKYKGTLKTQKQIKDSRSKNKIRTQILNKNGVKRIIPVRKR